MQYKGLTLDKFQEDAIAAIEENKSVVVSAPTGSGKTLIADYIIDRDVKKGLQVVYTAPIKALSNQKYKEFSRDYGEKNVGLLTGDVARNSSAPILIMTTEIYRNMVLADDPAIREVTYVIFDEIHFINDIERGYVWEESIIFSPPHIRMLCLSATIPNSEEFADWIRGIKQHEVIVIKHHIRPVPLHVKFFDSELGITDLKRIKDIADIPDYKYIHGRSKHRLPLVRPPSHLNLISQIKDKNMLPCLFFNLSRAGCQKNARELAAKKWFAPNPQISAYIRSKLANAPKELSNLESAQLLRQTLPMGIGFHHAGLLPLLKEAVEDLFGEGLLKVLYTTETFAVGINMPAKTACIESLRKFDGVSFRMMNSKEYFQMAGRAGRRGMDKEGFVYIMIDRRDFDYEKLKETTDSDKEPIKSQFRLSVNTIVNLIKQHNEKEINEILGKSFFTFQKYGNNEVGKTKNHFLFESYRKKLQKMGYLEGNTLTEKGEFACNIYSDELLTSELFATGFFEKLSNYQIFLLLMSISYEPRARTSFNKKFPSKDSSQLEKHLKNHAYASREKRFSAIKDL